KQNVATVSLQGTAIQGTLKQTITYNPASDSAAAPSAPASASASAAASAKPSVPANPQNQPQTSDRFASRLPDFGDPALLPALKAQNVEIKVNPDSGPSIWLVLLENLLPWLLLIGLFFFLNRRAGQAQQGIFSFGKSRAKLYEGSEKPVTFKDVAGVEESK